MIAGICAVVVLIFCLIIFLYQSQRRITKLESEKKFMDLESPGKEIEIAKEENSSVISLQNNHSSSIIRRPAQSREEGEISSIYAEVTLSNNDTMRTIPSPSNNAALEAQSFLVSNDANAVYQ